MNKLLRLIIFTVFPIFIGCTTSIPIGYEFPKNLMKQSTLNSLRGEDKATILASLGPPVKFYVSSESSYFIYGMEELIVEPQIIGHYMFYRLSCVVLKFDKQNIFHHYRIKDFNYHSNKPSIFDCPSKFFNSAELASFTTHDAELETFYEKELQDLPNSLKEKAKKGDLETRWHLYYERKHITRNNEHVAELHSRAESGDADAQFELYFLDEKAPLKWLCRAADQGHTRAEMWLAYLFETGSYGISRDYAQSYLWYGRAAIGPHQQEIEDKVEKFDPSDPIYFYCRRKAEICKIAQKIVELKEKLGTEGTTKAELMLEQWKPGDCEKGFLSLENTTGTE